MKILDKHELQVAEDVLKKHLPKSSKVYGFLYGMNRDKPTTLEVLVDVWPDFRVIICRPDLKACLGVYVESDHPLHEQILKEMLMNQNAVDWSHNFLFAGMNVSHFPIINYVTASRGLNMRTYVLVHLMYLPDPSHLNTAAVDSQLELRLTSLDISHVDLVNNTWKFGGNEKGYRNIKNLITNFPSCCITDEHGQSVSWMLVYDYCAIGILYTLPEHRGKGYAKVLISAMSKRLHGEGYPIYCFIEEDNTVSYRLFKNLGFIEDPSYRAAWFEVNF